MKRISVTDCVGYRRIQASVSLTGPKVSMETYRNDWFWF